MKKKIPWLVVSCLMVLSLVLASCAPAVIEEEEEVVEEEVVEEVVAVEKEMVVDSLGRTVEKPRYGGTLIFIKATPLEGFDQAHGVCGWYYTQKLTNEHLLIGNYAKGPSGSGDAGFRTNNFQGESNYRGQIAESWERPDDTTFVFHIRKGIRFAPADKAPTYGRELTADDVVFSIKRNFQTDTCYVYHAYPWDIYWESCTAESWEGSDPKYTVIVKSKPGKLGFVWEMVSMYGVSVVPRDAVEYYGNLADWKNAVGSGPFMLTDYVPDSSATLVRNPDYWSDHPLYPDMKMPFLDGVKMLIIGDASTRLAGLRSGKIDVYCEAPPNAIEWEDANSLIDFNPNLKYVGFTYGSCAVIWYRVDNPELPWYDIRVRRALNMAVDQGEILDTYYGGNADLVPWPVAQLAAFKDAIVPWEELPGEVQKQFEYHPDEAKALMAEAGYPDGFKISVLCYQPQVDLLSIVESKWKAVLNVDMELDVEEYGVYTSTYTKKAYTDAMMYSMSSPSYWYKFQDVTPGNKLNMAMIDDPYCEEKRVEITNAYFTVDEKNRLMREEFYTYLLEQNYGLLYPGPHVFNFWQPWVKCYSGERTVGYIISFNAPNWVWYDQDLKEEMTGRR